MKKRIKKQFKLFEQVDQVIEFARRNLVRSTNRTMVATYFMVGKLIVEDLQTGVAKAKYAERTIERLSKKLMAKYGKGYSQRNLEQMRKFYLVYQNRIPQNSSAELKTKKIGRNEGVSQSNLQFALGWSHYLILCRIEDAAERNFYEIEATNNNWNLEELQRQLNASLYERLTLSKNKKKVLALSKKGQIVRGPKDIIKNPLVLEFLGLEEKSSYSETDLETAIINQIEKFMLELGKGFFFGGRQVRFTFDEKHFFVDLVFYNRLLKCFVIVDLKIGELEHADLGQMQMYVNHYDRKVKDKIENPTIGIIICKSKSDPVVEITLPKNQKQIFASQYKLYLPTKGELKRLIERNPWQA
jgi:predicted nuclease of restriction endonuclease-like (RecB) superfamily